MDQEEKTLGTAPSAPPAKEAEHLARTFALAMRNVSVYPLEHPRARRAADDCLGLIRGRGGIILTTHDRTLGCNGCRLGEEPQFAWVVERLRAAALRGIVVSPQCTDDDLLEFARQLVAARRGGQCEPFGWPLNHARLRALPLTFTGTFGGGGSGGKVESDIGGGHDTADGGGRGGGEAASTSDAGKGEFGLGGGGSRIVFGDDDDGDVAARARGGGESVAPTEAGEATSDTLSLDSAIAETSSSDSTPDEFPDAEAFGASMLEMLSKVIDESARTALQDVLSGDFSEEQELDDESQTPEDQVLEKLRMSANIAQRYFGRPSPETAVSEEKPSGRPEDAGIDADLDELLAEIAALPDEPNPALSAPEQTGTDPVGLAHQLLGAYLYLYVTYPEPEARAKLATPMRRAFAQAGAEIPLLEVYLGGGDFRAVSDDQDRLALLELASQAGQKDLIRDRGYLDAALVVAGFPDCMPLAARVLGSAPAGLEVLREAIATLAEKHGMRAFVDIMREQALQDPEVVRAFVAAGGECAHAALSAVAWTGRLELYTALVDHLRSLNLPTAERRALASLRPKDQGAASYLQQLFREAKDGTVSDELRLRTGEMLRRQVQRARAEDDADQLAAAIEDLAFVPDEKTCELLREFGGRPRWSKLFDRLAAPRAKARSILQIIERRKS